MEACPCSEQKAELEMVTSVLMRHVADIRAVYNLYAGASRSQGATRQPVLLSLGQLWDFVLDAGLVSASLSLPAVDRIALRALSISPNHPHCIYIRKQVISMQLSLFSLLLLTRPVPTCAHVCSQMATPDIHSSDAPIFLWQFVETLIRLAAALEPAQEEKKENRWLSKKVRVDTLSRCTLR